MHVTASAANMWVASFIVRPLLVECHCYFLHDFLIRYAVIINYSLFWKKDFVLIKRKQGINNCFKIRTKRNGKINLKTKCNTI